VFPEFFSNTPDVNFKTTRTCYPTQESHINQVVSDTLAWEGSAAFRLERSPAVISYARNDQLGLTIPYEYQGVAHVYETDFLVKLTNGENLLLEVKGYEDDQTQAKHTAPRRWVSAVTNWGELGRWDFLVCRNPQRLDADLARFLTSTAAAAR
jgi:type III restriction enzyme